MQYLQVSTDEVYGSIEEGTFTEESPLRPSSPYSATKTGADLLVLSYFHTFGLPVRICRGSNNYGPYQYPEKLIPLMILNALLGDSSAGLRRRQAGPQLDPRDGLRQGHRPRPRTRRGGRGLQRRRPRRGGEHHGRQADHRADRGLGVPDRARHRPARPRPPLLALLGEGPGARLGAAGALRGGPRGDRCLVSRTTPSGGSRSARVSTASTTPASTGVRSEAELASGPGTLGSSDVSARLHEARAVRGSTRPSSAPHRPRSRPGRRSHAASTCCSPRRPARARRWRHSSGRWTVSAPMAPPTGRAGRQARGCST